MTLTVFSKLLTQTTGIFEPEGFNSERSAPLEINANSKRCSGKGVCRGRSRKCCGFHRRRSLDEQKQVIWFSRQRYSPMRNLSTLHVRHAWLVEVESERITGEGFGEQDEGDTSVVWKAGARRRNRGKEGKNPFGVVKSVDVAEVFEEKYVWLAIGEKLGGWLQISRDCR